MRGGRQRNPRARCTPPATPSQPPPGTRPRGNVGNGVTPGGGERIFPKIQEFFSSEWFPRCVGSPGKRFVWAGAALAAAFAFCGGQRQRGGSGLRGQGADPPRIPAPLLSIAVPARSERLSVTSSCNRCGFSDAGILSAHSSFAFYL